ncbi:MAG: protein phosphatase 2C domain-containing protein [Desulfamplus sp.]|nr:protein phosphatase 2C domain-containing protein [Desulfamplus sp.]
MIPNLSKDSILFLYGTSVCGFNHKQKNRPNQDAVFWWPRARVYAEPLRQPLIIAIADGHGGPMHFRSKIGAALAVRVAVTVLKKLLSGHGSYPSVALDGNRLQALIPRTIVHKWQRLVEYHHQKHELSSTEKHLLEHELSPGMRRRVLENPLLVYGTTLAAAYLTDYCLMYLQIGDGDILSFDRSGCVSRPLDDGKQLLLGGETHSLCLPEAWSYCRTKLYAVEYETMPVLICLTTDGYVDSFYQTADFAAVPKDIYRFILKNDIMRIDAQLEQILSTTSQKGSGDDITLGLIGCIPSTVQSKPQT